MNQAGQGESSTALAIHPLKRRRGRPRKDPSLKHICGSHTQNGSKEYLPQRPVQPNGPHSTMVGQPVTGVVEATFEAGYLLNVKIGNSTTSFRGLVFKPGHFIPVTPENDVAPHLQMIARNDVATPVRQKRKYKSRKTAPSVVPPAGERGTVVPVLLQPASNFPSVLSNSDKTSHMMSFGDRDVHMVEPLTVLPPDRSVPAGQIFVGPQVPQGVEKVGPTEFTESDSMESSETSEEETGNNSNEPPMPFSSGDSVVKPLFNYGTGKMTELLQALQDNVKENKVGIAEQTTSGLNVGFQEMRNETESANGASGS